MSTPDHFLASPSLLPLIDTGFVQKASHYSDHCLLGIFELRLENILKLRHLLEAFNRLLRRNAFHIYFNQELLLVLHIYVVATWDGKHSVSVAIPGLDASLLSSVLGPC